MARNGLNQRQMAKLMGMSQPTLNRALLGNRPFSESEDANFRRLLEEEKKKKAAG